MHTEVDQHEAPEPTVNLEAELDAPLETADADDWHEVISLDVPELDGPYCCRVGIGEMSAANADTRLVLHRSYGGRDVVQQTIIDDDSDDESWDTGDERELRTGDRLTLEYRRGCGETASIRRAHIFIESCGP